MNNSIKIYKHTNHKSVNLTFSGSGKGSWQPYERPSWAPCWLLLTTLSRTFCFPSLCKYFGSLAILIYMTLGFISLIENSLTTSSNSNFGTERRCLMFKWIGTSISKRDLHSIVFLKVSQGWLGWKKSRCNWLIFRTSIYHSKINRTIYTLS